MRLKRIEGERLKHDAEANRPYPTRRLEVENLTPLEGQLLRLPAC